jgi:hypothetical protein
MDQRQIALADDTLEFRIEPYHDFREEDRQRIADLWLQTLTSFCDGSRQIIEEVRARPLLKNYKLPKPLPDPLSSGRY